MPHFIFDSWDRVGEVALAAVFIYAALVLMLRFSGKRTLAKFNAFDFVVTVALGSMVANTILNEETAVVDGIIGIAVLIGAQAAVSFSVTRWKTARSVVKSRPTLLFYRGSFEEESMGHQRVAREEVQLAVREAGFAKLEDVLAIVLETDGTMSVIGDDGQEGALSTLENVQMGKAEIDVGRS